MHKAALFRGYGIMGVVAGLAITVAGQVYGDSRTRGVLFAGVAVVVLSAALVGVAGITDTPTGEESRPEGAPDVRRSETTEDGE
ncbi:MAG: hypothetical protein ABEH77_07835 [Halobacteriaceae archaeon]